MTEPREPSSSLSPNQEFVQLFTRGQRPLYLFILAQTGNIQSAEEILQETNVVIWSKMDQFSHGSNFLAWSRQIATYEILKHRQKFRRDKLTFSSEFLTAVSQEMEERPVEQELRREALQTCLQKLPEQDRSLIEHRYRPGISGKELAQQLGRPANSVYQSLGRIRRLLLDCVKKQLATEPGT